MDAQIYTIAGRAISGMILLLVFFAIYFLPWIIANYRKHPNSTPILLINLFLGWSFIGWFVALIWSTLNIKR